MTLLADRLGYVQLAEPVRFTAAWERDASLRLRTGDAIGAGRVRPARPHPRRPARPGHGPGRPRLRRQLPGRPGRPADGRGLGPLPGAIRPDPRRPDPPRPGRRTAATIRIADGAEASAGDLIICRAQRPPPRSGGARPDPGQRRRPADRGHHPPRHHGPPPARPRPGHRPAPVHRPGLPLRRLPAQSDLAYAVTGHSAQGATVHTGIALVTGTEDRQWLYLAMTRGTDANLAFVFTTPARPADPQPGTRARPRTRPLRPHPPRTRRIPGRPSPRRAARTEPDQREPVAVLADVLSRDGAELSASEIRQRNLANADHLAILHAIWTAETQRRPPRPLPRARHGRAPARPPPAALPPGPLAVPHPARRRTRRPGPRRGHPHGHRLPGPGRSPRHRRRPGRPDPPAHRPAAPAARKAPGPGGYPELPDPDPARLPGRDRRHDGRPQPAARPAHRPDHARLGDHRASARYPPTRPPAWTGNTRPPRSPPTGRCTATTTPTTRSVPSPPGKPRTSGPPGTQAFAALGPAGGPDVRAMPDGRLWLVRDTYAAETAWAPRHVGKELRLSRLGAFDAALAAIRADAEADAARKAGDHDRAARHETLAASYRALRDHYQQREQTSPRPWPPGRNGSTPPPDPGAWPSPPTPNCAAATPGRRSSRCAPPNQPPPATPNASSCIRPRTASSPRSPPGSAT